MITPLESRFEGWYYDGRSPVRHPATVELTEEALIIAPGNAEPLRWACSRARVISDGSDGEPIRLESEEGPAGEALIVLDGRFLEALRQHTSACGGTSSLLEFRGWRPALLASAAIVVIASGFYFWGARLVADAAARAAPRFIEERLGRAVVSILAPAGQRCSGPARARLLARVSGRLAAAARTSGYQFRVIYVNNPTVNAFAAPGGYIVVFQGLLAETRNPEEFAGVLAHEMQHVIQRHSTRALARDVSGRTLLSLIALDSGTPSAFQGAVQLMNLHYQRADEEQADTESIALLKRAHIRPYGLNALLRRLQLNGKTADMPASYLSTHPAILERAARVEAEAGARSFVSEPLMTDEEWARAREACAPR